MREADLHDRLARLATEAGLSLPQAKDVRARGDRRQVRMVTATAGLSVLAVSAGVVGISQTGAPTASLPIGTTSPGPSAAPSRTATPAPTPTSLSPSAPSSAPISSPPFTKIPASLSMLHEGEAGWTTNKNADVAGVFNPCDRADATVEGRTDARTLKGPGLPVEQTHSPAKVTHQLMLFATEQAATAAFVKLSAGGCGWNKSVMNSGDATSTHLARLRKAETPTQEPGVYWLHDANLVRTRNALLITYADASGAGMTSNMADQELNYILRPLCEAQLVCR